MLEYTVLQDWWEYIFSSSNYFSISYGHFRQLARSLSLVGVKDYNIW